MESTKLREKETFLEIRPEKSRKQNRPTSKDICLAMIVWIQNTRSSRRRSWNRFENCKMNLYQRWNDILKILIKWIFFGGFHFLMKLMSVQRCYTVQLHNLLLLFFLRLIFFSCSEIYAIQWILCQKHVRVTQDIIDSSMIYVSAERMFFSLLSFARFHSTRSWQGLIDERKKKKIEKKNRTFDNCFYGSTYSISIYFINMYEFSSTSPFLPPVFVTEHFLLAFISK